MRREMHDRKDEEVKQISVVLPLAIVSQYIDDMYKEYQYTHQTNSRIKDTVVSHALTTPFRPDYR